MMTRGCLLGCYCTGRKISRITLKHTREACDASMENDTKESHSGKCSTKVIVLVARSSCLLAIFQGQEEVGSIHHQSVTQTRLDLLLQTNLIDHSLLSSHSPARVPLSLVAKAPATCLPNVLHQLMYHCNYVFSIHSCSVDPKPGLIFSILPYMENGPNGLVLLKAHDSLLVGFVPVEDTLQHLVCLCVYSGC